MIFKWSIWGRDKSQNAELLKYSILTFRHHYGNRHDYVVCTDSVNTITETVGDLAMIVDLNEHGKSLYDIESKATWRKWCPIPRLDITQPEVYIDSDVFLVKHPVEIENSIADPKIKYVILNEFSGQPWQHGAMKKKATETTPFVNAGFFIQKESCDISADLERELNWWKNNVPSSEHTHHDEQGALAIALTPYLERGELSILPKDRYMLIGPNENSEIESIDSVTLFHAVYPEHPAFHKFKGQLNKILNLQ